VEEEMETEQVLLKVAKQASLQSLQADFDAFVESVVPVFDGYRRKFLKAAEEADFRAKRELEQENASLRAKLDAAKKELSACHADLRHFVTAHASEYATRRAAELQRIIGAL
jgi:ribosomal protein L9